MRKYFILQLKRMLRILPALVLVGCLLLCGVAVFYNQVMARWSEQEEFQRLQIAIVGTENSQLLQTAMEAVKSMDSSSLALDFVMMEQKAAKQALATGQVAAYMVVPEDFVSQAMTGNIRPVQFVCNAGGGDILSIVRDEFTYVLANMLLLSEEATFALELALEDYGYGSISGDNMNALALRYATMIIHRDDVYTVEELGIAQGLPFREYMLSGLLTVYAMVMTLPFAPVWVRDKLTLEQLVRSKGMAAPLQVLCEIAGYCLVLSVVIVPVCCLAAGSAYGWLRMMAVAVCCGATSYLVYSAVKELISGVLLQLALTLGMCYVCGCMYPIDFFPVRLQQLAAWLPAGLARLTLAGVILGEPADESCWLLLAVAAVMFAAAMAVRMYRMRPRGEENA